MFGCVDSFAYLKRIFFIHACYEEQSASARALSLVPSVYWRCFFLHVQDIKVNLNVSLHAVRSNSSTLWSSDSSSRYKFILFFFFKAVCNTKNISNIDKKLKLVHFWTGMFWMCFYVSQATITSIIDLVDNKKRNIKKKRYIRQREWYKHSEYCFIKWLSLHNGPKQHGEVICFTSKK